MAKLPTRTRSSETSLSEFSAKTTRLTDEQLSKRGRKTGTYCADCLSVSGRLDEPLNMVEQFETLSGVTCENGHGGAEGLTVGEVISRGTKSRREEAKEIGGVVTATWGEERFCPVQYNTFGVGPFSFTTTVREGETPEQALQRAYGVVEAAAERCFEQKCVEHLERIKEAAGKAKSYK